MNTYGSIDNATAGFYALELLAHAVPDEVLVRFAHRPVSLPKNQTDVVEFRRSNPFTAATTPLIEGVTPSGQKFSYETLSVQMRQYGAYAEFTDHIEDFSKDRVVFDALERLGEQATLTRELLLADVVAAGTTVTYGTGAARNAQTKTGLFNRKRAEKAVVDLRQQKARLFTEILAGDEAEETYPIEPSYIAVGPNRMSSTFRSLASENSPEADHFIPVARYGKRAQTCNLELGSFQEFRYIITTEFGLLSGKGAAISTDADKAAFYNDGSNYDVGQVLMFGQEAFGAVPLRGKQAGDVYVLNAGVARGGDPLAQRGTAGFKFYYAAKRLNEKWMLRIEVAVAQ